MAYIKVSMPDRGLAKHLPPMDINPRYASDCQNVFFEKGAIRKRWGYGSSLSRYNSFGTVVNYTQPIVAAATTYHRTTQYLYFISQTDVFVLYVQGGTDYFYNVVEPIKSWDLDVAATPFGSANANVTTSFDSTNYKSGTASLKVTVDAAFTTGDLFTAGDTSTTYWYINRVRFWFRSDITLAAGDMQFVIYDHAGANGITVDFPAYSTANSWQYIELDYTNIAINALFDPALGAWQPNIKIVTDNGAMNFWIDSLEFDRCMKYQANELRTWPVISNEIFGRYNSETVGVDEKARLFFSQWNNSFTYANAVRTVLGDRYNDATYSEWVTLLTGASDDDTPAGFNVDQGFSDNAYSTLVCANFMMGWNGVPIIFGRRELTGAAYATTIYTTGIRWGTANVYNNWATGEGWNISMAETGGEITNAKLLHNVIYLFKRDMVYTMQYIGGNSTIFNFNELFSSEGLSCPLLCTKADKGIYWVSNMGRVYVITPSSIEEIGTEIYIQMEALINYSDTYPKGYFRGRNHIIHFSKKHALLFLMVDNNNGYPTSGYYYDYRDHRWSYFDFGSNYITAGESINDDTYMALLSDPGGSNEASSIHKIDYSSYSDNGQAINAYWTSKAFSIAQQGHPPMYTNWIGIRFRAKGDSVTLSYSTDGTKFTEIGSQTLSSSYDIYHQDFHVESRFLWIKFSNNTDAQEFQIDEFYLEYEGKGAEH